MYRDGNTSGGAVARSTLPPVNRIAMVGLAAASGCLLWAIWTCSQASVAAEEPRPKREATKSRIFLTGIVSVRAEGKEKDEFIRMVLAVDPVTGKWTKIATAKACGLGFHRTVKRWSVRTTR
jgi:hypothetical protein